ncbi:zinc finger protein ZAT11-like [Cicer arietinum]|uniref:Zinc finger protein ZAT11-like n=1 Tax=Cicer arietinum TaxID=3827 RepID=A0A1S2XUJ7_CICAR|nr:zinc finger protein ZAT11-like [Cicer arietinum]
MKRQRDIEGLENINLANCLMMLSYPPKQQNNKPKQIKFGPTEFECKTCNRKFSSFQALGGHRASHKRSKLEGYELIKANAISLSLGNKPKMHECSICGQEFSLGQALGGHMRRHKAMLINKQLSSIEKVDVKIPILKRWNSMRVMCMDLNLTPLENDLKLLFGNMAPNLDVLV